MINYRVECQSLGKIVAAVMSGNYFDQLQGVDALVGLFKVMEVFDTPVRRRAICDDIIPLYEFVVSNNVPQRLIEMLDIGQVPLRAKLLTFFNLFVAGPNIASTPEDSVLHSDNMFFKKLVISYGLIGKLLPLLVPTDVGITSLAVECIGKLAADNFECRDYILQSGALESVSALITDTTPVELLQHVSTTIAYFCGVSHPSNCLPNWPLVLVIFYSHISLLLILIRSFY